MNNENLAKRIRELMWNKLSAEQQVHHDMVKQERDINDINRIIEDEDEIRKQLEAEMNLASRKNHRG